MSESSNHDGAAPFPSPALEKERDVELNAGVKNHLNWTSSGTLSRSWPRAVSIGVISYRKRTSKGVEHQVFLLEGERDGATSNRRRGGADVEKKGDVKSLALASSLFHFLSSP